MDRIDWNAKVKEALERTDIMALSTLGPDGSWTSPVQYRYGEKLDLYFMSLPDTKHVTNILKDSRVSVAIYYPKPFPKGGNLGLQIKGTAKRVGMGEMASNFGHEPDATWQEFKIIPDEVWCFDSRVNRTRQLIDLAELHLK